MIYKTIKVLRFVILFLLRLISGLHYRTLETWILHTCCSLIDFQQYIQNFVERLGVSISLRCVTFEYVTFEKGLTREGKETDPWFGGKFLSDGTVTCPILIHISTVLY